MFKQFSEYLANGKRVPSITELTSRKKRSTTNDDFRDFLDDMYPGAQQPPTLMVQMLGSPQTSADAKIESAAIFHKENIDSCQASEPECPENFFRPYNEGKCIHDPHIKMTWNEANNYCSNVASGNSRMLQFEVLKESMFLSRYIMKGE